MKRGRQSTTTPQALRQGNRAVAKATRYPEGGTSTNTGPGHHKGPTTGGEGGNKRQGKRANNSQEKDKRKGAPPHQERHTRAKGKDTHRNAGKSTNTTNHTTNRSQAREEKRHETKDKPTARKARPTPRTRKQTTKPQKEGGPGGELDPKKAAKRPPLHSSKRGQITTRCPGTRGTGNQNSRKEKHETKGKEEEGGRVATSYSV